MVGMSIFIAIVKCVHTIRVWSGIYNNGEYTYLSAVLLTYLYLPAYTCLYLFIYIYTWT